jgi:hypothetical protein
MWVKNPKIKPFPDFQTHNFKVDKPPDMRGRRYQQAGREFGPSLDGGCCFDCTTDQVVPACSYLYCTAYPQV